jgi:hypothetical protein
MKLTMQEVAYIGKMYQGLSEISLLANLNEIEDGSELFSLMEKEVIVEDELSSKARDIMDIVANADRCARLFVKDRFCVVEKYTYRFKDALVLVENVDGEMLFSHVTDLTTATADVAELIGASHMKSANISEIFSHGELLALLGVVDYHRMSSLGAYIGCETGRKMAVSETELEELFENGQDHYLSKLMIQNYEFGIPKGSALTEALQKLVQRGCLKVQDGYTLTTDYDLFAKGFLMPETLMTLEGLGYDQSGELLTAISLCVGAGLRDLVFIALGRTDAEMATVSGAEMLQLIDNYMKCSYWCE